MSERDYDLENRLIRFGVRMIEIAGKLPDTVAGRHLSGQLSRSGTSPALNYGEAQAAESPADFVHKMKVCLKELRETFVCLKFIQMLRWLDEKALASDLDENNQLVSIFFTSIKTANKNRNNGKNKKRDNDREPE